MQTPRGKKALLGIAFLIALAMLSGCLSSQKRTPTPRASRTATVTITPSATRTIPRPTIPYVTLSAEEVNMAASILTPMAPMPSPMAGVKVPDEVQVLLLLGLDQGAPYSGRSDAVLLMFYHPRLGRASLLSLPPDWLVNIPGYTVQRLYAAYPVGGIDAVLDTLQYNLGVRPNQYAVVHEDDFATLVQQIGGMDLYSSQAFPDLCGGIRVGYIHLDGWQTLCYVRLREGTGEAARNLRQQEVMRLIFLRLVQGGNLITLPKLYLDFNGYLKHNLTLPELAGYIPLALRLGDPARMGYFSFRQEDLKLWNIPGPTGANVFVPRQSVVRGLVRDAIHFVLTPAPMSDVVLTLQSELTTSPTATQSPTPTQTATPTQTRTITLTPRPTKTPVRSATITYTPTVTPLPAPKIIYSADTNADSLYDVVGKYFDPASIYTIQTSTTTDVLVSDWHSRVGIFMDYGSPRQIYSIRYTRANLKALSNQATGSNSQASVSPGNAWVVYRNVNATTDRVDLYMNELSTTTRHRLTNTEQQEANPSWSADGETIIFNQDGDLYTLDMENSLPPTTTLTPAPLRVTANITEEYARYSPDGTKLAYMCFSDSFPHWDICLVNLVNGAPDWNTLILLTNPDGDDEYNEMYPAWSSDSKTIMFSSNRGTGGQLDLFSIPVAGGDMTQLTNSTYDEIRAVWKP